MIKSLIALVVSFYPLSLSFAQDGSFDKLYINQLIKGSGGLDYSGWGFNSNNIMDSRPNFNGGLSYMINNHNGLTFSANSDYGGIRFYNQGYSIGPYEPSTGARMVMSIVNNAVGIGTTSPRAPLDVAGDSSDGKLSIVLSRLPEGDNAGEGTFLGVRGFNTNFKPTSKSFALEHSFYGIINSSINFHRGDDAQGGFIAFNTRTNIERMRIDPDGNIGIGTTLPKEKLSVNGHIRAVEIKVETQNWPDYVFEKNYKISSLADLEKFIKINKHLPDIPSAKNVKTDGIALGEMNAKLLKKIEELTLYLIEQNKEIELLKTKLNKL